MLGNVVQEEGIVSRIAHAEGITWCKNLSEFFFCFKKCNTQWVSLGEGEKKEARDGHFQFAKCSIPSSNNHPKLLVETHGCLGSGNGFNSQQRRIQHYPLYPSNT